MIYLITLSSLSPYWFLLFSMCLCVVTAEVNICFVVGYFPSLLSVPYQQNLQWMLLYIFVCNRYLHQRNLLECSITSAYEILLSLLSVSGAVSIRLILLIGEHCALFRMRHCSRHFLHNLRPASAFNELNMHPFMDFSPVISRPLQFCYLCNVPLRSFRLKFRIIWLFSN